MPAWVFGLDASYSPISREAFEWLSRERGLRWFAQCLWTGRQTPPPAQDNIRGALEAGLVVVGYISLTASQPGPWHVSQGRAAAGDLWPRLSAVAIDVELPAVRVSEWVRACDAVRQLGQRPFSYTSWHAWHDLVVHDVQASAQQLGPLWNAYWDEGEDIDFPARPYGPWTPADLVVEQYSGGRDVQTPYGVIHVDLNTVSWDWFKKEEHMPTLDEIRQVVDAVPQRGATVLTDRLLPLEMRFKLEPHVRRADHWVTIYASGSQDAQVETAWVHMDGTVSERNITRIPAGQSLVIYGPRNVDGTIDGILLRRVSGGILTVTDYWVEYQRP